MSTRQTDWGTPDVRGDDPAVGSSPTGASAGLYGVLRSFFASGEGVDLMRIAHGLQAPKAIAQGCLPGGYAQVTTAQTLIGATQTDLTGLSVSVNVASGRQLRLTGKAYVTRTVADGFTSGVFMEGATYLGDWAWVNVLYSTPLQASAIIVSPSAGVHTYRMALTRSSGTGTTGIDAGATYPAFILVEDMGPVSWR